MSTPNPCTLPRTPPFSDFLSVCVHCCFYWTHTDTTSLAFARCVRRGSGAVITETMKGLRWGKSVTASCAGARAAPTVAAPAGVAPRVRSWALRDVVAAGRAPAAPLSALSWSPSFGAAHPFRHPRPCHLNTLFQTRSSSLHSQLVARVVARSTNRCDTRTFLCDPHVPTHLGSVRTPSE